MAIIATDISTKVPTTSRSKDFPTLSQDIVSPNYAKTLHVCSPTTPSCVSPADP